MQWIDWIHMPVEYPSKLEMYYWLHDYGDTKGIVEFLSEWVSIIDPQDIKKVGIVAIIVIALLVGWKSATIFKNTPTRKD